MSPLEKHLSAFRSEQVRLAELLKSEELKAERVVSIIRLIFTVLLFGTAVVESFVLKIPEGHYIVPYLILMLMAVGMLLEVLFMIKTGRFKKFQNFYKFIVITVDVTFISIVMIHSYNLISSQFPNIYSLATSLCNSYVILVVILLLVNLFRFNVLSSVYMGMLGAAGFTLAVFTLSSQIPPEESEAIHRIFYENLSMILITTVLSTVISSFFRRVVVRSKKQEKLERFLPEIVAKQVLTGTRDLEIGGEKRRVTVLFSDIRDFTSFSEQKQPEEVIDFLNSYFNDMISIIFRYNGSLDKIIGDGIMALFGVPFSNGNEDEQAVMAAKDMLAKLRDFNDIRRIQGEEEIRIGIGIHSGEAIIGNVGCEQRMDFTAIGDAVNTASRLQDLTKKAGTPLLFSREVMENLTPDYKVKSVGKAALKGKAEKMDLFSLEL